MTQGRFFQIACKLQWNMIVHTIVVVGTIIRKMRIGDTIPKLTQNVTHVKKDAAQTPIVAALSVAPAIVAGGITGNVLYLDPLKKVSLRQLIKDFLRAAKDSWGSLDTESFILYQIY